MINSRELALAQALEGAVSVEPMCISVLTLPKLIDVVLEEGKIIDNILALLEAGGEPVLGTTNVFCQMAAVKLLKRKEDNE